MGFVKMILTTGVVYARSLLLQAGTSTAQGAPPVTLFASDNAVSNAAGEVATLISYSLPANVLANDGDMIEVIASTTQANDADQKASTISFGATVVASRSGVADAALPRNLHAWILRKSGTTQVAMGNVATQGQGDIVTHSTPGETLSGAVNIVLSGQNQTDTTSPSVTSRMMLVRYWPVGQASNFS